VLLDFLGDVVCGGFGLPIARDMCQKVIVVGSNDLQSLYVANNVCSAVQYFRKLGGNVGVAGMVINKDDGTGEAAGLSPKRSASRSWPRSRRMKTSAARAPTTRSSASPTAAGDRCSRAGLNVGRCPPVHPEPLDQDGLLGLFDSSETGGGTTCLSRRQPEDMCPASALEKPSLEVVYDDGVSAKI
jgi:chlorophyllide a reductase subunit X